MGVSFPFQLLNTIKCFTCDKPGQRVRKSENLVHQIRWRKFAILPEEFSLQLTFSFTSFKIEFKPPYK